LFRRPCEPQLFTHVNLVSSLTACQSIRMCLATSRIVITRHNAPTFSAKRNVNRVLSDRKASRSFFTRTMGI